MQNKKTSLDNFRENEFLVADLIKRNSKLDTEPETQILQAPLTVEYEPGSKLLEFVWQRSVSSNEYRQCIRFIGLCVAMLRAKFILVDFRKMGNPTLEEQKTTEQFLRNALLNSTLIRSARVLSNSESQQQVYKAVLNSKLTLPYQVKGFLSLEKAKEWLFSEPFKSTTQSEQRILIPVHCSIKELKKLASDSTEPDGKVIGRPDDDLQKTTRCLTDFMEIVIDKQNSLLQLHWLRKTSTREHRYGVLKASRALLEHQIASLMVNNQRQSALTLQDQTWLVTHMKSLLERSNVKKIGVVLSPDMMQQMASESLTERIVKQNSPFKAQHFLSVEEARDWLCTPKQEESIVE